jgi:hypothetical protein
MRSIKDISDLINIRNYVASSVNNFNLKRETTNHLNKVMMLLDRLIINDLNSDQFKSIISFEDADEVVKEVAMNNNIKANLSPSNKTVTMENGKPEIK